MILPLVLRLVQPRSLIDVGCGVGTWLAEAERLGINRLVGIEGDWVRPADLRSRTIELRTSDLERPISSAERFDLSMSLEVAEHLTPGRADSFVAELCALGKVVLFGAAIPGAGEINHINEQWQSAWAARFARHAYHPI